MNTVAAQIFCPVALPAATKVWVNDMNDQELLHDYVQNGSEAAFAALVRKHIDLVYSAALRMVLGRSTVRAKSQKTHIFACLRQQLVGKW